MTTSQRNTLIESYSKAYDNLTTALTKYPKDMWQWKPAPDKWSIHEVIIHIADSEANSYIRCRRFIAEPGSGVYGYADAIWAKALHYHDQSTDEALELFRMLRHMTYKVIKNLPDEIWLTATVQHSESGLMTFERWLEIYDEHISIHIRQIERTYQQWLQSQKG